MSNRLGGKQGTAYTGTNANQPPNWTFNDRDPNQYDVQNVSLGDMWLNQNTESVWVLVSLAGDPSSKGSLATWSKLESGGSVIGPLDTITGTSGGPVGPDVNSNINLVSGIFGLSFDGNPLTNTITLNSIVPDNVVETITGNNGGPVPALLGNINIVGDNVGITIVGDPGSNTLTASLIGGGDAAETFITDSGTASAIGGVINFIADPTIQNAGSSVFFSAPGPSNIVQLNVTDGNNNTLIGLNSGNTPIVGTTNTGLGEGSGHNLTSGSDNTFIGASAGTSVTSGIENTFVGEGSGELLVTGNYNTCIGQLAGGNYAGAESSNICIGSSTKGTLGESNVLRIGRGTGLGIGQLNQSFIAGIRGIAPVAADGIPVYIDSNGQLGTVGTSGGVNTVTGNIGGAVSPAPGGNINIVGDGATINITGNPLTNTLTVVGLGGGGGTLTQLDGDTGSALPVAGVINILAGTSTQVCGSSVTFIGAGNDVALEVTDANGNTIVGFGSGNATLTGMNNTIFGDASAAAFTTGSSNTFVGQNVGAGITTGSQNILIGLDAGSSYTTAESNNILLNATGTVGESNVLRIGEGTGGAAGELNEAFISGIIGITPATADGIPVFIGSAGQLGTVGTGGTTLISTVTGNAGGAVSPLAGNINIVGDGVTIQITGNPLTNTLTAVGLGGGGGTLTQLDGDTGMALPVGGTINITTAGNAGGSVSFTGSGNTLEFNVSDTDFNTMIGFQAGNDTLTGTNNTIFGVNCGSSITTASNNILLGIGAGSSLINGSGNFICGNASLNPVLTATTGRANFYAFAVGNGLFLHNFGGASTGNTFVGLGSGGNFNAGQTASNTRNTACGQNTLAAITIGTNNTTVGFGSGPSITTGSFNTLLGSAAGVNYTSAESSNIAINSPGFTGFSNILSIGAGTGTGVGQINKAFISGIRGITTGVANALPVMIDSAGQLGTAGGSVVQTLTGSTSGGPVPASAGNINLIAGTGISIAGNAGLNQLTISATGGASGINTITGNTGGAVPGSAGNIKILGGSGINIAGNIGTNTLTVTATGSGGVSTLTGNVGGAVSPDIFGNINIVGDGTTILVTDSPGLQRMTISAIGGGGSVAGNPSFMAFLTNEYPYPLATEFQVTYDTTAFNLGGAYNGGASRFTAPATGLYNFSVGLGLKRSNNGYVIVTTSSRSYVISSATFGSIQWTTGSYLLSMATGSDIYANMTAGDTATVRAFIASGVSGSVVRGTASAGSFGADTFFGGQRVA